GPNRDGPDFGGPRDHPGFDRQPPEMRDRQPPDLGGRQLPDVGERLPEKIAALFNDTSTNGYYYAVWFSNGTSQKHSTNEATTNLTMPGRPGNAERQSARTRGSFREVYRFTSTDRCVLVGRSIATDLAELRHQAWWLAFAAGSVLLLGLF